MASIPLKILRIELPKQPTVLLKVVRIGDERPHEPILINVVDKRGEEKEKAEYRRKN